MFSQKWSCRRWPAFQSTRTFTSKSAWAGVGGWKRSTLFCYGLAIFVAFFYDCQQRWSGPFERLAIINKRWWPPCPVTTAHKKIVLNLQGMTALLIIPLCNHPEKGHHHILISMMFHPSKKHLHRMGLTLNSTTPTRLLYFRGSYSRLVHGLSHGLTKRTQQ